jgi:multicomponent Na+:H+ antiporter subunit G
MDGWSIASIVCLGIGCFFNLLAAVGLLRFPDVYTRLHAGTKCTTFGTIFVTLAVMLVGMNHWIFQSNSYSVMVIHAFIALICLLLTNPTGAHAIARAAHRSGVKPALAVIDELEKDELEKNELEKEEGR